jgi:hypothetical protein
MFLKRTEKTPAAVLNINIASHSSDAAATSTLARGLNFVITLQKILSGTEATVSHFAHDCT